MDDTSSNNSLSLSSPKQITRLSPKTWTVVTLLSIAGQIAWAVENSWFNVFVFDEITTSPTPIAWMVAVSAVVATLTTIIFGAVSDRSKSKMGRRKPFILFGYIIWGIITALFPTVELIQNVGVAVVMVVIMDGIMTFFGSMANDAAFNAWTADITDTTNRGRLQGVLQMSTLIANLIAIGASGFVIETWGYFVFFYVLGGFVTVIGLIAGIMIQDPPVLANDSSENNPKFFEDLIHTFKPSTVKQNPVLYILLVHLGLVGIAAQISSPYTFVYLENFLDFDKGQVSIIGGTVILVAVIVSIIYGFNSHRLPRKPVLMLTIVLNAIFGVIFYFVTSFISVILVYAVILSLSMVNSIVLISWIQDLYPVEDRGKFQGIRMVFFVAIPMVFGPIIGSNVIKFYGEPIMDGTTISGYVPSPEIFLYSGIISLLALIPLFFISKFSKKITDEEEFVH
ncbi:MFS transporter [Candidatus Lokiarchaeum ossiferum]|uniref:MFS transporter n=1 Tax=Candidatus Lokiarchaeum ossiferum TaxID=2951803 RepID=UPI00352DC6EA